VNADTQEQLRKVRKFSRVARGACLVLFAVLGILTLWTLGNVAFGPGASGMRVDFGAYSIHGDHFVAPAAKIWGVIVVASVFALLFSGLGRLYLLFGNFLAGDIYTRENVRHIRALGLLAMAMAVFQIFLPMVSWALLQGGVIDASAVTRTSAPLGASALPGFITAGVILLASWIMDVGRNTQDEANTLRRDAELVV
jgi:hypothetical protein